MNRSYSKMTVSMISGAVEKDLRSDLEDYGWINFSDGSVKLLKNGTLEILFGEFTEKTTEETSENKEVMLNSKQIVELEIELKDIDSDIRNSSLRLNRWKEMGKFMDRHERKAEEIANMKDRANKIMDHLGI